MTARRLVQTRQFSDGWGLRGRLLGKAQCVVRCTRSGAFIKTISDILCFPFRPSFISSSSAGLVPHGVGEGEPSVPRHTSRGLRKSC